MFAQSCENDLGLLHIPGGTGLICGTGTFTSDVVKITWAVWDPTVRPDFGSGTISDIEVGDRIAVLASSESILVHSGPALNFIVVQ